MLGGQAVHARAGARENYPPVRQAAGSSIPSGDAYALAREYIDRLGIMEIYVADLDAIAGRSGHEALIERIAALGMLWLDAGVRSVDDARRAMDLGAAQVIVGLETLPSFETLGSICAAVGGERVAFSLDLRNGDPVVLARGDIPAGQTAESLVTGAADAGASTLIVIDLARVGTSRGLDAVLVDRVRTASPGLTLVAGGGVRGWSDLVRLAEAGCDGALVATALHEGAITAADIQAARTL